LHGTLAEQAELTEDMTWCPPLFGQGVVNAVAVGTGSGVVKSLNEIPPADRPTPYTGGPHRTETRHTTAENIEIVTLVSHPRVETLIVSRRFDA
jgi:hypothetical protein